MHTKGVLCASCDIACALTAHVDQGRVVKISQSKNPLLMDNICMKGVYAPKGFAHPDRVLHPLKRVGESGSASAGKTPWRTSPAA